MHTKLNRTHAKYLARVNRIRTDIRHLQSKYRKGAKVEKALLNAIIAQKIDDLEKCVGEFVAELESRKTHYSLDA